MPQHSSILFSLLLAATFSVDMVAAYWTSVSNLGAISGRLLLALLLSQVNLLSAWAILRQRRVGWRWVAPIIGGLVCALISTVSLTGPLDQLAISILGFACLYWINAFVAWATLWFLKPTRLYRRQRSNSDKPEWQFSMKNVLVINSVTSLLLAIVVTNDMLGGLGAQISLITVSNIVLLVAITSACSRQWHWLLKLGAALGVATAIGYVCNWLALRNLNFDFIAFQRIQAIVLFIWLELGPILPRSADGNDSASAETVATLPAES